MSWEVLGKIEIRRVKAVIVTGEATLGQSARVDKPEFGMRCEAQSAAMIPGDVAHIGNAANRCTSQAAAAAPDSFSVALTCVRLAHNSAQSLIAVTLSRP
jgi:hypothetical protein